MAGPDRGRTYAALTGIYGELTRAVTGATDDDLLRCTRCLGWTVADLLFHQLLDAQRALVALNTPADAKPDVDHISYWAPFRPGGEDNARHSRFVRAAAAAFDRPVWLVRIWTETSTAVLHAAASSDLPEFVRTQGHVLALSDFLATLVVEATVHYLDLTLELPAWPLPADAAAVTRTTLNGLLTVEPPAEWDDTTYVLLAGGRLPLRDRDRDLLGSSADRFPLLG
jgi:hypothetical protein